jgi:CheY-like chemotaxis protein
VKPVRRTEVAQVVEAAPEPVQRVLVVDDDPDTLQLFSHMLRVCDSTLEIITASSGEQALSELRRFPPDLLLLDIVMPDMSGWQVLESMAADERIGEVPTYFLSAQDPANHPPVSGFLLTTIDKGLPLNVLLRSSLEISRLLQQPEGSIDPVPR